jgi:hypothetical protein
VDNGAVQIFQEGGSGFTPIPGASYKVFFDVVEVDGVAGCKSHLIAIGGGRHAQI